MQLKKLVVVGAGQIGTSLVLAAAAAHPETFIVAYDTACLSGEFRQALEAAGVHGNRVLLTSDPALLEGADLVVLATPVGNFKAAIAEISPWLDCSTLFTDVGSVKRLAQSRIRAALNQSLGPEAQYVPFHILNGNAGSGPATAAASVFKAPGVLVPGQARLDAEAGIAEFWTSVGVSVYSMSADQHDLIFGTTSHLEHAIMFSLMNTNFIAEHLRADIVQDPGNWLHAMSRIAVAGPLMWADNFKDNGDKVLETAAHFRRYLVQFLSLLEERSPILTESLHRLHIYARDMQSLRIQPVSLSESARSGLKVTAFLGLLSLAITANVQRVESETTQRIALIANPSLKDGMGPVAVAPNSVESLFQSCPLDLEPLVREFLEVFDGTLRLIEEEKREALLLLVTEASARRTALT